jgi:hypothetical protein
LGRKKLFKYFLVGELPILFSMLPKKLKIFLIQSRINLVLSKNFENAFTKAALAAKVERFFALSRLEQLKMCKLPF